MLIVIVDMANGVQVHFLPVCKVAYMVFFELTRALWVSYAVRQAFKFKYKSV